MEIVTKELKDRMHKIFKTHDEIVGEQEEYIERLRAEVKQLRGENRQIDKNAAAVQKEYKKEIERLQSAYLRAVTERDNAIFQLTRLKAERDRAVVCIRDIETYLELGSGKYVKITIDKYRETEALE